MQILKNTYFLKVVKVIFPLTILIVLYIEGKKQIQTINVGLVFHKVQDIGFLAFIWLVILGLLAVSSMIFYDWLIAKRLKMNVSTKNLCLFGFSANSFANFMGFGGFAGVALRTLFYRKYTTRLPSLLKNVTIILPYMLCGLSVFAWVVLAHELVQPVFLHEYPLLKLPLLIVCGYGPFIVLASHFTKSLVVNEQIKLTAVSVLEWLLAAIVFWQTSIMLNVDVPFIVIFVVFFMAAIAGVLSTVPGGVGAFDFVVLVGLAAFGTNEEKLIALLLLYRLVYYVVPFLASGFYVVYFMFKEKAWEHLLPDKETWSVLCHRILSIWVLIVGVLLLLFPVIPVIVQKIKIANEFLSMEVMQLSQHFSIGIGITLLVLARAIDDKVKRAYYFTFIILVVGLVISFSKGFHVWEAFMFLIAMLLLYFSKNRFYRKRSPYTLLKGLIDGIIILCIALTYVLVGSLQFHYIQRIVPRRLQDLFSLDQQSLWHDVGIGFILAILLLFFGLFFSRENNFGRLFQKVDENSIKEVELSSTSHKPLYYFNYENTTLYYQKWLDNLLIIKELESSLEDCSLAYKKFVEESDKFGFNIIVPQIRKEEISMYAEYGFQIVEIDGKWFAVSKNVSANVAKSNIKWLIRYRK
ncbi:Phosphatidylglycerol lysyltransferase [Sutcliffiella rhizosphaerae]|uniref:Phosphatidylglycerol lysyltransferase n=2 Tax=Sutcliffiella rhizosphaerae TaxID=2880967 RepID=A0ABN8AEI8_9BACI|nr:Phosphatidylglycerol lysyltransferase [Sutcliffiella rhizosphaerae]